MTSNAHFPPSSRFIEAIAATQGVYKRQNTKSAIAFTGDMIPSKNDVFGNTIPSVTAIVSPEFTRNNQSKTIIKNQNCAI